jgi:hypothetical protein
VEVDWIEDRGTTVNLKVIEKNKYIQVKRCYFLEPEKD